MNTDAGFESHRDHLRAVAYRMLGSLSEADDAVQETWLRYHRADTAGVDNLAAWLTTVVGRVCLNMLRARRARGEEPLDAAPPPATDGPEADAVMADSVGLALLVVLDALVPDERLAFVLHDMFSVPFDAIAPLVERSPEATRKLASRARRRVRGTDPAPHADLSRRRSTVDAFLAAVRGGDFDALVSLLHPDVVLHADAAAIPTPRPVTVGGAHAVAKGAMAATGRAHFTGVALVDGAYGLIMAPLGRVRVALGFTIVDGAITAIDVIADPERVAALDIATAP
ncbi:MAG TPA: sigma-70 family RNA polymerase sigma factor [Stackebrandtia sp.]|jgi:RNA polymerase sigma-70 factor (ECF subfamily)|uniref:sigma-70 family RNA polymerase sigma factor n=1 Tax=Stackebrandtia sp. TaxID=2023065 RepID=UPI002D60AEB4|nr:sigma-70 family RNA polymerase sigma factor [Stackebrandtia sp.]HZE37933.1 sigma-70 family RNA polymerase sigma factor [Stackebrandtia sp.]